MSPVTRLKPCKWISDSYNTLSLGIDWELKGDRSCAALETISQKETTNTQLVGALNPSEKYKFVSWDDDIPNCFWNNKSHVPNHQPLKKRIKFLDPSQI